MSIKIRSLLTFANWLCGSKGIRQANPLSFLDHRIRCGNSLIGVLDPGVMADGIPDDAFTPVTGDDKKVAAAYKKRNKLEKALGQERAGVKTDADRTQRRVCGAFWYWTRFSGRQTIGRQEKKAELFAKARGGVDWWHDWTAANLWTAAFFLPLTKLDDPIVPTQETYLAFY